MVIPKGSLNTYCEILEEKERFLAEYSETTFRMKNSVEQQDQSVLSDCIKKRQSLINRIEKIDRQLGEAAAADKTGVRYRPNEIKERLKKMERGLNTISEIENECILLAEQGLSRMKNEIMAMKKKRRATGGYKHIGSAPARFVDTKK